MLLVQKQTGKNPDENETSRVPLTEELEDLLVGERNRTVQFVLVIIWTIFATSVYSWMKHEIALWFIVALFIYVIIVQLLYVQKHNLSAFRFAGIGALVVFVLLYQFLNILDFSLMIESASLFTIVGTLFFRRRYLFYTNIASFVLYAIGAISVLNDRTHIASVLQNVVIGFVFLVFVVIGCWMFMGRSLRLLEKLTEAKRAMMVDGLTQTYNRAYFDAALAQIDAIQPRDHVSILVLDIDHFKQVNDSFGHVIGDKALAHFTKVIRDHIRQNDAFIRVGGEEFALLVWHTPDFDLERYSARLVHAIQTHPFEVESGRFIRLTTSIGVATYVSREESIHLCFNRADQALYLAKDAGRNQAVLV